MVTRHAFDIPTPYYPFRAEQLYMTDFAGVGILRCHPDELSRYGIMRPAAHFILVFPRSSVQITFAGHRPILANPNVVMLYNRGQLYRRDAVNSVGDRCDIFGYGSAIICETLRDYGLEEYADCPDSPFAWTHSLVTAQSYLRQREVVEYLLSTPAVDRLYVDEMLLQILQEVIENAIRISDLPAYSLATCGKRYQAQRDVVFAAQEIIVNSFHENLSLSQISAELHISPSYLCRIFHKHTGITLHNYREQIRLRTALEYLPAWYRKISDLAYALGYASHSYFTNAFRRNFAIPPSHFTRKLNNIVIA